MRILLVEDDLLTAHNITTEIDAQGFHCDTVNDTADALDLLRHTTYDAAILDHYLQGETTLFLAAHLRLRHPGTKIITITGSALFARGYGLNRLESDFLFRKPFAVSDLIKIVKYLSVTSDDDTADQGFPARAIIS